LHFIQTIHRHHPTEYTKEDRFATLIGDPEVWKELTEVGVAPESILEGWKPELERFKKTRQKYLIPEYKE
ncbi:MAG: DUF1343 domain-containing protein, partial [Candidatus Omnitrophica bacterium]|nr:DUF1343 domain-containing protein [Candidatus Omnitrophota bacterium]